MECFYDWRFKYAKKISWNQKTLCNHAFTGKFIIFHFFFCCIFYFYFCKSVLHVGFSSIYESLVLIINEYFFLYWLLCFSLCKIDSKMWALGRMVCSLTPIEQWFLYVVLSVVLTFYVKAKFVIFTIDVFILSWKLICLDYNIWVLHKWNKDYT